MPAVLLLLAVVSAVSFRVPLCRSYRWRGYPGVIEKVARRDQARMNALWAERMKVFSEICGTDVWSAENLTASKRFLEILKEQAEIRRASIPR